MIGNPPATTGSGLLKSQQGSDVLILGAGFSKAVSSRFPLTDDLGALAVDAAEIHIDAPFSSGRFEAWLSHLAEPQPYLTQAENTANLAVFEKLVGAIHVVMCEVERSVVADGLPAWLFRFVAAIHARRTVVITFNYDRIIERAVEELAFHDFERPKGDHVVAWADVLGDVPPYPPVPPRWAGGSKPTLRLLKLHGSLNWYWVPGDFTGASLHHWELDDDDDRARYLPGREPFVVPPAATKSAFFRNPVMAETWKRAASALRTANSVALLGYSLPVADLVAGGMIGASVRREGVELTVVNPEPRPVVESIRRLTGHDAREFVSVEEFSVAYVDAASRVLASQVIEGGPAVPTEALVLVGWSEDFLARAVKTERSDRGIVVLVEEYDESAPFAPVQEGSSRRQALQFEVIARQLRAGDVVEVQFANGARSTVVGIDRRITETGASRYWQILVPADRPSDVGVTNWRQKLGLEAS